MPLSHDCSEIYRSLNFVGEKYLADPKPRGYGSAIDSTMEYDLETARWWIGNGEYGSPIRYCPYCGLDLMTLVKG
jgi:hypothetical protein